MQILLTVTNAEENVIASMTFDEKTLLAFAQAGIRTLLTPGNTITLQQAIS